MKIGIVTTWFERGAAYVSKQYMHTLEKDNDVYIYARGGERYAINEKKWDCENVTWGKSKREIITDIDLADFKNWLTEYAIEIVLFNEQIYWEPIILAKRLGIKTGAYIDYYTLSTLPAFGLYDFLLCNTKRHYSVFRDFSQCYYIPWGTDTEIFRPNELGKRGQDGNITFFMSAGYAPKRKGVDAAVRAFSKFTGKDNCRMVIHTQVNIKEAIPECSELVDSLVASGRLNIIQRSISAPGLYYMGDVYVYPSWLDGIGLTLAEAISSGMPVITTDNAPMNEFGNSEFVRLIKVDRQISREDAYYWPLSIVNEDSLYQAMEYYLQNTHELPRMKAEARKYALSRLDWANNSSGLNEIISSVKIKPLDDDLVQFARKIDKRNRFIEFRAKDYCERVSKINKKIEEATGKIVIYCAGGHTNRLISLTDILSKNVIAVIDKENKECEVEGIEIVYPERLMEINPDTVIISSYKYQDEIEKELLDTYRYAGKIIKLYDSEDQGEFYDI